MTAAPPRPDRVVMQPTRREVDFSVLPSVRRSDHLRYARRRYADLRCSILAACSVRDGRSFGGEESEPSVTGPCQRL